MVPLSERHADRFQRSTRTAAERPHLFQLPPRRERSLQADSPSALAHRPGIPQRRRSGKISTTPSL